eukprot:GDKI01049066.1.p1 GENE.GDKI01049066.1~~GDKI01049066.1.p1  ORF type:complete len:194 (-),score=40.32 GDKI01049066.1:112-693(-)
MHPGSAAVAYALQHAKQHELLILSTQSEMGPTVLACMAFECVRTWVNSGGIKSPEGLDMSALEPPPSLECARSLLTAAPTCCPINPTHGPMQRREAAASHVSHSVVCNPRCLNSKCKKEISPDTPCYVCACDGCNRAVWCAQCHTDMSAVHQLDTCVLPPWQATVCQDRGKPKWPSAWTPTSVWALCCCLLPR